MTDERLMNEGAKKELLDSAVAAIRRIESESRVLADRAAADLRLVAIGLDVLGLFPEKEVPVQGSDGQVNLEKTRLLQVGFYGSNKVWLDPEARLALDTGTGRGVYNSEHEPTVQIVTDNPDYTTYARMALIAVVFQFAREETVQQAV